MAVVSKLVKNINPQYSPNISFKKNRIQFQSRGCARISSHFPLAAAPVLQADVQGILQPQQETQHGRDGEPHGWGDGEEPTGEERGVPGCRHAEEDGDTRMHERGAGDGTAVDVGYGRGRKVRGCRFAAGHAGYGLISVYGRAMMAFGGADRPLLHRHRLGLEREWAERLRSRSLICLEGPAT
uniref:Uncharacterized protein n=1 Tax=Pyricularia oryzae (strain P131) TaxID=1143193 RepID=L7JEB2_PYRO1